MTFLVTGATGFVGGAVVAELLSGGHRVRALVRSPTRADALRARGVELVAGDVTDPETLRPAMDGADGVFHLAAWYKVGVRDPSARRVNVDGTRHVLEAMRAAGVPRGVYTSTLAVNSDTGGRIVDERYRFEGRHLSVYDETKAEAHRVAEQFIREGLPLTIVQPGAVYGPGDTSALGTLFRDFLARTLPPLPARTAFCWGFIDDVARGHLLAMERGQPGRSYFLAGPVHTLVEAIRMAETITGIRGPRLVLPPAALRIGALLARPIEAVVRLPPAFTSEGLRVLAGVTYLGSAARARAELGWRARPLEDGLRETLRALRGDRNRAG